jgi:hypothetical protein
MLKVLLTLLLFGWAQLVFAQFPGSSIGNSSRGNGSQFPIDSAQRDQELDTFKVNYRFAADPFRSFPNKDTAINRFFHQFDPTRARTWDYRNLGNAGSAAEPIVYEPTFRRGFSVGLNQYNLYYLPASQMPFYEVDKPFLNVAFFQAGEQNNSGVALQFCRNFGPGLTVSIDYRRINLNGETTLFPDQRSRDTGFGIGFWFKSKKKRYTSFLTFTNNRINSFDNGGVISDTIPADQFSASTQAAVYLSGARTRHQHQELLYTQYLQFGKVDSLGAVADTLRKNKQIFQIAHSISLQNNFYRYSDSYSSSESTTPAYYGAFLTDIRGVRNFIQHQKVENSFRFITFRGQSNPDQQVGKEKGRLELGITHALHRIRQEPKDSILNELFLTGRLNITPSQGIQLRTAAQLAVLGNVGDYQLTGDLQIALGKLAVLHANALNQLYSPTLVQREFIVSQQAIWNNNFRKTLETNFRGSIELPRFLLEVGAGVTLLNNFIYSDTSAVFRQSGVPVSVLQAFVRKDFVVWKFHLENQAAFQSSSQNVLRVPQIFGKHSFYFSGRLFKVLDTWIGVDLRYQTGFYANTYFPLTGQFRLNDQRALSLYPGLDFFASFRITKFRAFIKFENMGKLFLPKQQYFAQTAYYPLPPSSGFRFGFQWRFSN